MRRYLRKLLIFIFVCVLLAFCAVPGMATVTPSCEKKEVPDVIAYYIEEDGTVVVLSEKIAAAKVWSLNSGEAPELDEAYKLFSKIEDVGDIIDGLDEFAKELNEKYNSSIFVVSDLFDVSIPQEYIDAALASPEHYVEVHFYTGIAPDAEPPVIAHKSETTGKWIMLDPECVENDGHGTIIAKFDELCPMIFMRVSEERVAKIEEGCQCGCFFCRHGMCLFCGKLCDFSVSIGLGKGICFCWILPLVIIFAIIVVIILLLDKKKKEDKKKEDKKEETVLADSADQSTSENNEKQ